LDIRKVKKLIEMMEDTDIGEIEIKEGDDSVRISRSIGGGVQAAGAVSGQFMSARAGYPSPDGAAPGMRRIAPGASARSGRNNTALNRKTRHVPFRSEQPLSSGTASSGTAVHDQRAEVSGSQVVHAPMVGTFYHAPDPESAPFVQIGDQISRGDTLCIIESMKMMNRIEAEFDGIVEEVLIENESGVEYDQPLFVLKTSLL